MDFGSEFLKKLDKAISRLRFAKFLLNLAKFSHKFSRNTTHEIDNLAKFSPKHEKENFSHPPYLEPKWRVQISNHDNFNL